MAELLPKGPHRRTARQAEIERLCARHELESDEMMTREEKAERIIDGQ